MKKPEGLKLEGRVAIVTGAGQGVGLGIAQALSAAGANIVMTGRDADKLRKASASIEANGVEVLRVPGDVSHRAHADEAVAATIDRFGRLDVLVNNAQSAAPGTLFEDCDDELIAMILGSGFYGTLYFMQAAFPHLKERGGSVINLGSRQGVVGHPGDSLYGAGKEAIRGLSRSVAREWGQYKIRVNTINPAALSPGAVDFLESNPEEAEMYRQALSLRYFGDCFADIGPIAVFLASDDSRYLTGQTLNADGGQVMP